MNLPKTRTDNIVVQQLEKEILIYDLLIDKAYCLNETSALVYQNCDGKTGFGKLKTMSALTDDLIFFALDELRRVNLLDEETVYQTPFAGMTRRQVIRRVGLASVAVLPLISMLSAPSAANAASVIAPGSLGFRQACNNSTECSSGAPNCTTTPYPGSRKICCIGDFSYYDTGGTVNSCSGGSCSSATFVCQSDAGRFCCSGSVKASCSGNSCACKCL